MELSSIVEIDVSLIMKCQHHGCKVILEGVHLFVNHSLSLCNRTAPLTELNESAKYLGLIVGRLSLKR
jgi:hypothetical protein